MRELCQERGGGGLFHVEASQTGRILARVAVVARRHGGWAIGGEDDPPTFFPKGRPRDLLQIYQAAGLGLRYRVLELERSEVSPIWLVISSTSASGNCEVLGDDRTGRAFDSDEAMAQAVRKIIGIYLGMDKLPLDRGGDDNAALPS